MRVLILYATVEGQTGKIARFAAERVQAAGHTAVLTDAGEVATLSLDGIDRVILAAPVHERRHPDWFEATLVAQHDELAARPVLLLSVSLSAAFPEGLEEAQDYVAELKMRTHIAPAAEALVAGAVLFDRYDYYATQVLRHVVLRGKPYDPQATSHEFTDWEALETTLSAFLH